MNDESTESLPRIQLSDARLAAGAIVAIAETLDQHDRDSQLRILEAVCVMLGEDEHAARFRAMRAKK